MPGLGRARLNTTAALRSVIAFVLGSVLLSCMLGGCSEAKPQGTGQDFGFRFESGACFTDVLDTFEGTFTKDLIYDPPVTIPLRLSDQQMKAVYRKMIEIDFFGYPDVFAIPTPTFNQPWHIQTPAERYHIVVRSGGTTKTLDWKDEIVEPSSHEANNLRALFMMIDGIITASPEYRQLPAPQRRLCVNPRASCPWLPQIERSALSRKRSATPGFEKTGGRNETLHIPWLGSVRDDVMHDRTSTPACHAPPHPQVRRLQYPQQQHDPPSCQLQP